MWNYCFNLVPHSGQVSTTESDSGFPALVYLQSVFGHLMVDSALALGVSESSPESEQPMDAIATEIATRIVERSFLVSVFFMVATS